MTISNPSNPVTAPAPPEALAVPAALAVSSPLTPAAAIATEASPTPADRQGLAILLMCTVSFIFAIQDALSRHLVSNYSTYFVVMLRYWFFAAFVVAMAARAPGGLERATAPAHATGDVPIAGPVVVGGAEAHGGHAGHAQGRAAVRPRTR